MMAKKLSAYAKQRLTPRFIQFLIAVLLLCTIITNQPALPVLSAPETPAAPVSVYLPLVTMNYPMRNVFGVTMSTLTESNGLTPLAQAGTTWTRRAIDWGVVENVEGARNWNAGLEAELVKAAQRNIQVVLIIETTPAWALKPGFPCGAVASNKFPALASFAADVVSRYSQPPYNIHYYEMWNEPDAAGVLGCWGNVSDSQYYGGSYYGSMLNSVYARMKAADPQAQVLVGGLLLDCDPSVRPNGRTCTEANFLKGILAAGAGPSFDGVSFHAYDHYQVPGRYSNDNWNTASWNKNPFTIIGPSLVAKAAYLRNILQGYGYPKKYLISTENALFFGPSEYTTLCDPSVPADLELTKAYYLVEAYTVSQAEGLIGNIWYAAIGTRCASLFETNLTPKPAFQAYAFLRPRLQGAVFRGKITGYPGVTGYEFTRRDRIVWGLWASDNLSHVIQLPKVPAEAFYVGNNGNPVSEIQAVFVNITDAPHVIEFTP
jgi:hypothetical protein